MSLRILRGLNEVFNRQKVTENYYFDSKSYNTFGRRIYIEKRLNICLGNVKNMLGMLGIC